MHGTFTRANLFSGAIATVASIQRLFLKVVSGRFLVRAFFSSINTLLTIVISIKNSTRCKYTLDEPLHINSFRENASVLHHGQLC